MRERKRKNQVLFSSIISPTVEQKKILDALDKSSSLKIKAFAGSGKTTTLKMIAEKYRDKKILYLAFNRAISEEAKRKFPENVRVSTVHSLAYAELLKLRRFKPIMLVDNFNSFFINQFFGNLFRGEKELIAEAIKRVFLLFCYSDCSSFREEKFKEYLLEDDDLDALLWEPVLEKIKDKLENFTYEKIKEEKEKLLGFIMDRAEELYEAMKSEKLSWTHDFYLKFFVEEYGEKIEKLDFDFCLLDEAQDSNPITLKLFKMLKGKKVMVGDPHQQIYAWRGSINVMNNFEADELYLSVSFRFHQGIADLLNRVLELKGESVKIFGVGNVKENVEKICLIARANSTLIKKIYELEKFSITRDLKEIFRNALIVEALKKGQRYIPELGINVPQQYQFFIGDYAGFVKNVKSRNDVEMMRAIALLEEFKSVREVYYLAKAKCDKDARIVLSTAHSAKGLEWDAVCVLDDFMDIKKEYEKLVPFFDGYESLKEWVNEKKLDKKRRQFIEEVNLYYVALSRGISKVVDLSANEMELRSTTPRYGAWSDWL